MPRWSPLGELADRDSVENVLIFVSDALRYDYLPDILRERGLTARAIAPSTFTASSLPSLTTGRYPTDHKVWRFSDRLPARPPLLSENGIDVGFDAETVWIELESHEKPPLQIHHVNEESTLSDLAPPFCHIIHDVGPHAPYGFENEAFDSMKQFFREYERQRSGLVDLYAEDCRNSANRFLAVYEALKDRDLLSDTLVVFTSDHGQALGDRTVGGRFGHGHPMCPETVEIPIVFMGAGLPTGDTYGPLLSGTDIAPTLLSAQRTPPSDDVAGTDLWRTVPDPERKIRSDIWQHLTIGVLGTPVTVSIYAATSVWDEDGGYVFHQKSRAQRVASLLYDNAFRGYAPAWRANLTTEKFVKLLSLIGASELTYGDPGFSPTEARERIPTQFTHRSTEATETSLTAEQKDQLRNLGYLR